MSVTGAVSNSVTVFDPAAVGASVTALPSMSTPRLSSTLFQVARRMHVLGGASGTRSGLLASEDVIDVDAATVTALPVPTPHSWIGAQVAAVSGSAIVMWARLSDGEYFTGVDRFDAATNSWSEASPYPYALRFVSLTTVQGHAIGAGGRGHDTSKRRAAVYDFSTNTWHDVYAMPERRDRALAAELSGRAFFIGGEERREVQGNTSSGWIGY
jgi:hypothetical protein